MKEKELEKQLERIKKEIIGRKIIPKAMDIAKKYGVHKSETHSCHTSYEYKFLGKDYCDTALSIDHTGGWSMFGGEGLLVEYDSKRVFYADTSKDCLSFDKKDLFPENFPRIKIGELYVHEYYPGQWEEQLELIYRKGPKKEKKPAEKVVERDVDESRLKDLVSRLPIKI